MTAQGSKPMKAGSLQSPFPPSQHRCFGSGLMFLEIGGEGTVVGATQIGVILPAECFIEVDVRIHQPWQRQQLRCRIQPQRFRRQQPTISPAELHRSQALLAHRRWPGSRRELQQAAWNPGLECLGLWC